MQNARTQSEISKASETFRGTCGESVTACQHRFIPAFRCEVDGRIELARLPNGQPAPMHLIVALPREWASQVNKHGGVLSLIDGITAGFWREDRFYTRAQAVAVQEVGA